MFVTTFPHILHPPEQLYYRGNIDLLYTDCVAVIGTRKPTAIALEKTKQIVFEYRKKTIVSGLARGIDITAHIAALENGIPTIAVLPNGVDEIYPKLHTAIAERILLENGLLLSEHEYAATESWLLRERLMQRNRIITGIASLVIPVEFNQVSGTMHAIRYAQAQDKEIRLV